MKKGLIYIFVLCVGVLMLVRSHLHVSLGDNIFSAAGISPWLGQNTRLHLPVLLGFILLLIGMIGTVKIYKPRYPKILSRLIIACVAFMLIFPWASEKLMFVLKHNSNGIHSIDYLVENSECHIKTSDNEAKARCSFTFYNYGAENSITIQPVFEDRYGDLNFEASSVSIIPHSKVSLTAEFIAEGHEIDWLGSGYIKGVEIEVEMDGVKKRYNKL
ncbi:hypothetical protein FHR92_002630 [Fontibacillus solani]|uniref:Uncharacterized protein n=1 Tax=Fontibacillus solani TaxID=1572857 RepID=A0A7W3STW1_9BACL|nr:hypothetical protein [Fontibacillus solani]MBA9086157.1 hypothetical protein [Fontibacillus solani]